MTTVEVFVGPFGSGKTEVALNRALSLAAGGEAVTFIDLDLVDPFFRGRRARDTLEAAGITVVAPAPAWDDVDLPLLTPDVFAALSNPGRILVDAGGEAHGALAVRQLLHLLPLDAAVYLVVNPYRPFMRSAEEIAQVAGLIAEAAGRPLTALVANPNLASATTADVVREGLWVVEAAARNLGLPAAWTAVGAALLPELSLGGEVQPLRFHMLPFWEVPLHA
ncbi:MAG TPA: hypothetical protein VJ206_01755 [bacterium]|nr:hypothetical protein [bacterium]